MLLAIFHKLPHWQLVFRRACNMARYQQLPDRIDTFCSYIPDQAMCMSYGMTQDCCVIPANGKCQANITTVCAWTVPPGVSSIFVELWGPGGGGGGGGSGATCVSGTGGSSGGYSAATIPTAPGCVYTVCAGIGGCYGCCGTAGTAGTTAYMSGYNTSTFLCAAGGTPGCSVTPQGSIGLNTLTTPSAVSTNWLGYSNNYIVTGGQGGNVINASSCALMSNRGGSSSFNGGIGGYFFLSATADGGGFPGGGGSAACTTTTASCGACGGSGLVRIWY